MSNGKRAILYWQSLTEGDVIVNAERAAADEIARLRAELAKEEGERDVKQSRLDYVNAELNNWIRAQGELIEERDTLRTTIGEYQDMMAKCAQAAGIDTPLELIARAENDQERYGDILARIIAERLATARADALAGVREQVELLDAYYTEGTGNAALVLYGDVLSLLDGAA